MLQNTVEIETPFFAGTVPPISNTQETWDYWYPKVYGFFYRRMNNRSDVEEITSETVTCLMLAKNVQNPQAFVWQVARNKLCTYIRNKSKEPSYADFDGAEYLAVDYREYNTSNYGSDEEIAEETTELSENYKAKVEQLRQCLSGQLKDEEYKLVYLSLIDNKNSTEVGLELDMKPATVRQKLRRILNKLRERCVALYPQMSGQLQGQSTCILLVDFYSENPFDDFSDPWQNLFERDSQYIARKNEDWEKFVQNHGDEDNSNNNFPNSTHDRKVQTFLEGFGNLVKSNLATGILVTIAVATGLLSIQINKNNTKAEGEIISLANQYESSNSSKNSSSPVVAFEYIPSKGDKSNPNSESIPQEQLTELIKQANIKTTSVSNPVRRNTSQNSSQLNYSSNNSSNSSNFSSNFSSNNSSLSSSNSSRAFANSSSSISSILPEISSSSSVSSSYSSQSSSSTSSISSSLNSSVSTSSSSVASSTSSQISSVSSSSSSSSAGTSFIFYSFGNCTNAPVNAADKGCYISADGGSSYTLLRDCQYMYNSQFDLKTNGCMWMASAMSLGRIDGDYQYIIEQTIPSAVYYAPAQEEFGFQRIRIYRYQISTKTVQKSQVYQRYMWHDNTSCDIDLPSTYNDYCIRNSDPYLNIDLATTIQRNLDYLAIMDNFKTGSGTIDPNLISFPY